MTDHEVDTTITRLQPGDIVDITIRGVRITEERPNGTVVIKCDDDKVHGVWPMPPQAAVKRADVHDPIDAGTLQDGISKVLAYLDHMEAEGYIQPHIAVGVRTTLGLPPRHWPPQAGDVWSDGCPFTDLWFARKLQAAGPGWNEAAIVMTCVEVDTRTHSPDELLKSSPELTLVYRKRGDQ